MITMKGRCYRCKKPTSVILIQRVRPLKNSIRTFISKICLPCFKIIESDAYKERYGKNEV